MELYYKVFPETPVLSVGVIITSDLNMTYAKLRPDKKDQILHSQVQNDFNGRMVVPDSTMDTIHILLNSVMVKQYTEDGSMTWVGTVGHEFTHAVDFYTMAQKDELTSYTPLEEPGQYLMFQQWTEYHARKCGYRFLREFFNSIGLNLKRDEQISHILQTEAPMQTNRFHDQYQASTSNNRLYLTMQYLGRYSVWMDLFPTTFTKELLMELNRGTYWLWDILEFLRDHETLDQIYGHFEDKKYCYFIMQYIPKRTIFELILKMFVLILSIINCKF